MAKKKAKRTNQYGFTDEEWRRLPQSEKDKINHPLSRQDALKKYGKDSVTKFTQGPLKSAVEGFDNFLEESGARKKGQKFVKEFVKRAPKGIWNWFGNHNEWYTKYPNKELVAPGLDAMRGIVDEDALGFAGIKTDTAHTPNAFTLVRGAVPGICAASLQRTIPNGDDEGWNNGIQFFFDTLTSAQTSVQFAYNTAAVQRYIFNVGTLAMLYFELRRVYQTAFAYRADDSDAPAHYIEAMGFDHENIRANLADILSTLQTCSNELVTNYPLNISYLERIEALYSSIILDHSEVSDEYLIFTHAPYKEAEITLPDTSTQQVYTGPCYIDWASGSMKFIDSPPLLTFEDWRSLWKTVIRSMKTDDQASAIRRDIYKAYGPTAMQYSYAVPTISSLPTVTMDDNLRRQFRNASVMSLTSYYVTGGQVATAPHEAYYYYADGMNRIYQKYIPYGWNTLFGEPLQMRYYMRKYGTRIKFNAAVNALSQGDFLSMSRLKVCFSRDQVFTESFKVNNAAYFEQFNTEFVVNVATLYRSDSSNLSSSGNVTSTAADSVDWLFICGDVGFHTADSAGSSTINIGMGMRESSVRALHSVFSFLPPLVVHKWLSSSSDPTYYRMMATEDIQDWGYTSADNMAPFNAMANISILRPNAGVIRQDKWVDYFSLAGQ